MYVVAVLVTAVPQVGAHTIWQFWQKSRGRRVCTLDKFMEKLHKNTSKNIVVKPKVLAHLKFHSKRLLKQRRGCTCTNIAKIKLLLNTEVMAGSGAKANPVSIRTNATGTKPNAPAGYGGYPAPTSTPPKSGGGFCQYTLVILAVVIFLRFFAIWAFGQTQDYKNNSDKKPQ